MFKRYINKLTIPAFFALVLLVSACTKQERLLEPFQDFSSTEEEVKEITKTDKNIDDKDAINLAEADLNEIRKYNIGYLAFDVADIYFEFKPVSSTSEYIKYKTRVYSKTNGTVDYFMGWMSHSYGTTKVYDKKVLPGKYQTKTKHKKKTREIELAFNSKGELIKDRVIPADNRKSRPAVSKANLKSVFDPLSGIYEARMLVENAFNKDNFNSKGFYTFTVPVFDGRRRTDFLFTLEKKPINNNYRLSVGMKPIDGYTAKELDKNAKGKGISITFMLDKTNYMPVEIIGKHPLGSASADFKGVCAQSFEACLKK